MLIDGKILGAAVADHDSGVRRPGRWCLDRRRLFKCTCQHREIIEKMHEKVADATVMFGKAGELSFAEELGIFLQCLADKP